MIATPDEGDMCGCRNRGCYMSYASGKYASKYVERKIAEGAESSLSKYTKIDGEKILNAYKNNDALASQTIERMAKYFAVCLFNVYQMLNINIFVFGGGLTNFGDILFKRIREHFDDLLHIKKPVEFCFAELKKDFGIIGASELVRD